MELPTRQEVLQGARRRGLKIAAVLPIHYPRALLRAHGFHPMELWGPPGLTPHGDDGHFPEYTCAIVRNAAAFLAGAGSYAIDCVLVPHACDSLQGMGAVLGGYLETGRPTLTMYHPRETSQAAEEFLAEELRRLGGQLKRLSGQSPSAGGLHAALDLETRADQHFNQMCFNRRSYALDNREFYTLLRSREYLPVEDFLALEPPQGAPPEGRPVMLSGIVPEPMSLFDHLSASGALVVGDDLACCGRRVYQPAEHNDPYRRLARQMLSKPPDPTTGHPVAARIEHLVKRMEQTGAQGLIVLNVKFCEPELFFLPMQRKALEQRGWPTLYVEESLPLDLPHQTITRLEAFLEVLP